MHKCFQAHVPYVHALVPCVVDPNRLCSDPDPGYYVNSDPDPAPDPNRIRINSDPVPT